MYVPAEEGVHKVSEVIANVAKHTLPAEVPGMDASVHASMKRLIPFMFAGGVLRNFFWARRRCRESGHSEIMHTLFSKIAHSQEGIRKIQMQGCLRGQCLTRGLLFFTF